MIAHIANIETPPEGMFVYEAVRKLPKRTCCSCNDDPSEWIQKDMPFRRCFPGDMVDLKTFLVNIWGSVVDAGGHTIRLYFIGGTKYEDNLEKIKKERHEFIGPGQECRGWEPGIS